MKIETLLNINDAVFFLHERKVVASKVQSVKIEANGKGCEVVYLCNDEPDKNVNIKVEEKHAFKSKEELLKSL
jgi:hypothetical protein